MVHWRNLRIDGFYERRYEKAFHDALRILPEFLAGAFACLLSQ